MPRDALIAFTGSASRPEWLQVSAAMMDLNALRSGTRERALRQWMRRGGRLN